MMLLEEIEKAISQKREKGASNKDKFIFDFLNREKDSNLIPFESLPSAMDKICYAAFLDKKRDVSQLVKKTQGEQPVMGLHYSNNLTELTAMAIHDFAFEEARLREYINNCSLKEQYILKHIFPGLDFRPKPHKNKIELLISEVLLTETPTVDIEQVISAFSEVTDLIDLFIIKHSYKTIYSLHPDRGLEQDLEALGLLYERLISYLERRFRMFYGIILGILTTTFIVVMSYFIIPNWEKWELEPLLTVVSIALPLVIIVLSTIFIRKKKLVLKSIFENQIERSIEKWFWMNLVLARSSFQEIMQRRNLISYKK